MRRWKLGMFWTMGVTLVVIYAGIQWVIPWVSRTITGMPFPLTVPGTLKLFYMILALVAIYLYVTSSEEKVEEFVRPIRKSLGGDYGKASRGIVLVVLPLAVGWQVYDTTAPKVSAPTTLRIQHPSSNFPKEMEALKNPLENPSDEMLNAFIQEVRANQVSFIPQVMADVQKWREANSDSSPLAFIPTEPVARFLTELKSGNVSKETAKAALREKDLFEGRALYALNCRPCHGDSVSGDGPMADGFRLRPINFTDNGTIETIVEGYTFWRVSNGGAGLPVEATPWDSAMPTWKLNISEEERWKIILAEYDMAQKTPRIPEKHEKVAGAGEKKE
ncbi:MAG: cytochrome c [Nitrospirae bacterium]|nr:cytochrome c [Nitrospirota bacterium]